MSFRLYSGQKKDKEKGRGHGHALDFCWDEKRLERALHGLDAEAFDDVVGADVFVVFEGHATFLAGLDFLDFILEALERLELAFVDNDVVAQEADAGTTFHDAFGDLTSGNLADLGDLEDFEDLGVTDEVSRRSGLSRPLIAFFTSSTRS